MIITVSAIGDFWTVRCDGVSNDMMFLSGACAELTARRLGTSLASAGARVEVRIFDRRGEEVGRFVSAPAPSWSTVRHVPAIETTFVSIGRPQARVA
jgi:hypothetical protein